MRSSGPLFSIRVILIGLAVCLPGPPWLAAQSTISPSQKHAYAANAGWVSFLPTTVDGVVVTDAFLAGYAYAANFGWIHFGDGTPGNGYAYSNSSSTDSGVNHDGTGSLSGFAYAANAGWISFGWGASDDPAAPRINLLTGAITGYAYGANIGWINLGTGLLSTASMSTTDVDHDGISDAWESRIFGNLATASGLSNQDGDSASDLEEFNAGTDPTDPDDLFRILATTYNSTRTEATVLFSTNPTRLYRLESSAGLGISPDVWTVDAALGTFLPDSGGTTTRIVPLPAGESRFIRAVAVKPLP